MKGRILIVPAWLPTVLFVAVVVGIGTWLRLDGLLSRGLEYDELWTLQHYARPLDAARIFGDLRTPNNHPLHSLLVGLSLRLFEDPALALRFPAFIPGVALLFVVPWFALRFFDSRVAALTALILVVSNGGLIHYAQTSRGYSLQVLLIALLALTAFSIWRLSAKNRGLLFFCSALLFVEGVSAVFVLPTSILFILPIMGLHLLGETWRARRVRNILPKTQWLTRLIVLYAVYGTVLIVCIMWFLLNFADLQSAQSFGTALTGLGEFVAFTWGTLQRLMPWGLWGLAGVLFVRRQASYRGFVVMFFVVFTFVTAWVAKAGPPRVYLPLIPALCVGAAGGVSWIFAALSRHWPKATKPCSTILVVLALTLLVHSLEMVRPWTPPDWGEVFDKAQARFPIQVYVSYPATAGYPLCFNRPQAPQRIFHRAANFAGKRLVQVARDGAVNGLDLRTGAAHNFFPYRAGSLEKINMGSTWAWVYELESIRGASQDEPGDGEKWSALAVIGPGRPSSVRACVRALLTDKRGQWLLLNPWLAQLTDAQNESNAAVFAARDPLLTQKEMIAAEKKSKGLLRFYRFQYGAGGGSTANLINSRAQLVASDFASKASSDKYFAETRRSCAVCGKSKARKGKW